MTKQAARIRQLLKDLREFSVVAMHSRSSFAYCGLHDGQLVTLNLKDEHRGHMSSHRDGISPVTDIGALFAVECGSRLLVLKVRSLSFAEPREAHRAGIGSTTTTGEPLRNIVAVCAGFLLRHEGSLTSFPTRC